MNKNLRRAHILKILENKTGSISVRDLAYQLGHSPQNMRSLYRDLHHLWKEEKIHRERKRRLAHYRLTSHPNTRSNSKSPIYTLELLKPLSMQQSQRFPSHLMVCHHNGMGQNLLSFQAPSLAEAIELSLQLGDAAQALRPAHFRLALAAKIKSMVQMY